MSWETYYKTHLTTIDGIVNLLPKENAVILAGQAAAEPKAILHAMAERCAEFHGIALHSLLALGEVPYCRPGMEKHFHYATMFAGAGTRDAIAQKRADFLPIYYYQYPDYVRKVLKPDVAILHVSPPDAHGWCSFGVTVDYQQAAAETARLVVAQVNRRMPRSLGPSRIHVTQIHALAEVDQPLPTIPRAVIGPVERAIGSNCAALIRDADCLQLGIGAIPDAVLAQLGDKHDLGIHSEMLSDSVAGLMDSGVITNRSKQMDVGASTATFAMGTESLYRFLHDNPAVNMAPVDYTNDPRIICQQDNMVTVNSALEIDLWGQVTSDAIGGQQYSGVGGQADFVRGANMSRGGRNIIILPATASGGRISRICPRLPEDTPVTTNRFDVDYVVTEYGTARLWGRSNAQRAEALIAIAHPDFREALRKKYQSL